MVVLSKITYLCQQISKPNIFHDMNNKKYFFAVDLGATSWAVISIGISMPFTLKSSRV